MNFVQKIIAYFRVTSVSQAIASFQKAATKLESVIAHNKNKEVEKLEAAIKLKLEASVHTNEAEYAEHVLTKIKELIG